jgi:O-acetyl-ADP-ribose deacetylase (regulator of RNase III)
VSVAIPAIGTGEFGYPKEQCAKDTFQSIETFALWHMQKDAFLKKLQLTIFPDDTVKIFRKEFENRYPRKQEIPIKEEVKSLGAKKVRFAP